MHHLLTPSTSAATPARASRWQRAAALLRAEYQRYQRLDRLHQTILIGLAMMALLIFLMAAAYAIAPN